MSKIPINNQDILDQLVSGEDAIKTIKINDKEMAMRPLTDGELSRLKALEKEPVNVDITFKPGDAKRKGFRDEIAKKLAEAEDDGEKQEGKATLNSGTMSESQDETKYLAIAWSLSIDDRDVDPVAIRNLDAGIPDQLFKEVIKISNLSEDSLDTVKQFLKNR